MLYCLVLFDFCLFKRKLFLEKNHPTSITAHVISHTISPRGEKDEQEE